MSEHTCRGEGSGEGRTTSDGEEGEKKQGPKQVREFRFYSKCLRNPLKD